MCLKTSGECDGGDWFLFILVIITLIVIGFASILVCYDWYIYSFRPSFIKLYNCIFYKKANIVPIPVAIETNCFIPIDIVAREVVTGEVKIAY